MTTDRPLVSVGIPTYNRLPRLQRAVASVLAQDYPNLELVVSDNASTDGTEAWLAELAEAHPNVVVHRNPANIGPTRNFNQARDASRGDLLLWLGDDDVIEPGYVSACAAASRLTRRPCWPPAPCATTRARPGCGSVGG